MVNYPTSLDTFTNPSGSDPVASPSHSSQHGNINDAVEALQAKVGVDSSTVATSLDKRVADLESAPPGSGDMEASTYDPTTVAGDVFDMDNMVEGTTTKIMTDTERTKLTGIATGAEVNTIDSDPSGVTGADQVTNIMSLTTAEYAAIGTPNASTFYLITDA